MRQFLLITLLFFISVPLYSKQWFVTSKAYNGENSIVAAIEAAEKDDTIIIFILC